MNVIAVVALVPGQLLHLLHQGPAEGDIDHLGSTTDREEGQPIGEGDRRQRQVEGVLLLVDVVEGWVVPLPGPAPGQVLRDGPGSSTASANATRARTSPTSATPAGADGCRTTGSPPAAYTASINLRDETSAS